MTDITRRQLLTASLALPLVAAATGARAATYQIAIQGFAFSPAAFKVAAGDTVIFVNNDSAPHTATAKDGSFDTGRINPGQSAQVTIPAGSHPYFCKFHPAMKGTASAS